MNLLSPDFRDDFSPSALAEARGLLSENRVYRLRTEERRLRVYVLGDEPMPFEVELISRNDRRFWNCECGAKEPCVHLASLMLKAASADLSPNHWFSSLPRLESRPASVPPAEEDLFQGDLFAFSESSSGSYTESSAEPSSKDSLKLSSEAPSSRSRDELSVSSGSDETVPPVTESAAPAVDTPLSASGSSLAPDSIESSDSTAAADSDVVSDSADKGAVDVPSDVLSDQAAPPRQVSAVIEDAPEPEPESESVSKTKTKTKQVQAQIPALPVISHCSAASMPMSSIFPQSRPATTWYLLFQPMPIGASVCVRRSCA